MSKNETNGIIQTLFWIVLLFWFIKFESERRQLFGIDCNKCRNFCVTLFRLFLFLLSDDDGWICFWKIDGAYLLQMERGHKNPHKNRLFFYLHSFKELQPSQHTAERECNFIIIYHPLIYFKKWLKWPELYELLLPTLIRRPSDDNGFCTHERSFFLQSKCGRNTQKKENENDNVRNISHIWIWILSWWL